MLKAESAWESLDSLKHEPKQANPTEKPLETWVGQKLDGTGPQGITRWTNNASPLDGDSHTMPACWLCWGRTQNCVCQHFFLAESCMPPKFLPDTFQFLPLCPWCLLSCCPTAGAQREWVQVSPCESPVRVTAWTLEAFCLTQPQSPLVLE